MRFSTAAGLLAAAASSVAASGVVVNNNCGFPVYIYIADAANGNCDTGPNGICNTKSGAAPWTVAKGGSQTLSWVNNSGTSVKIATKMTGELMNSGVLQFEYTYASPTIWWDLSDLDGSGADSVGSPFWGYNVQVTTNNPSACAGYTCAANQVCSQAYQTPGQLATHSCPTSSVNTFDINLCTAAKREVAFSA